MKKIALILILVMTFLSITSCGILDAFGSMNAGEQGSSGGGSEVGGGSTEDDGATDGGTTEGEGEGNEGETPENPDGNDNPRPPAGDNDPTEDDNGDLITVSEVLGLNEQIYLSISATEGFSYKVFYKLTAETEYSELDEELMITDGDEIKCYVLGLKSGKYDIKIEAESDSASAAKTVEAINVLAQDRSGYAHFKSTEGVGGYNNDGTVKDGATIIYVTNENKNTVTAIVGGTEYVGLVNILQAQYKADAPLIVRIIGRISTNQWNYKNVAPRLADGSNATDDFFVNTFSTEHGDNLANLIVKFKDNGGGKTYNYRTTPNGLTDVRLTKGGTKSTTYKGSDFPALKGKTVFDDDSYYNMIEVKGSKNITIEGVGTDAEIFQFGIGFEECNNIEINNLTFTDYPEDALNFLGGDREDLANYSRYWIHNCTFNRGYNAWDLSGERDKYAGDGSIDFNNVSNMTLAYNHFNNSKKSMLFGSGDSEACMNFTMHHNIFEKVESRLPLGRNVNLHSYNNFFNDCGNCSSVRQNSYIFSEKNYYYSCNKPFDLISGAVKSYYDIYEECSSGSVTITTIRYQTISNSCKPDKVTDYSKFDTNPTLFYYNFMNASTNVSVMIDAADVPEFLEIYAGAGKLVQLEVAE